MSLERAPLSHDFNPQTALCCQCGRTALAAFTHAKLCAGTTDEGVCPGPARLRTQSFARARTQSFARATTHLERWRARLKAEAA